MRWVTKTLPSPASLCPTSPKVYLSLNLTNIKCQLSVLAHPVHLAAVGCIYLAVCVRDSSRLESPQRPQSGFPPRGLAGSPGSSSAWTCARSRSTRRRPWNRGDAAGWPETCSAAASWGSLQFPPSSLNAAASPPGTGISA